MVLVFRYVKYFYEWGERREVVEGRPTARHPGEATEQADPAILNPHFFLPLSEVSPRNKGRLVSGWWCGGEGYG